MVSVFAGIYFMTGTDTDSLVPAVVVRGEVNGLGVVRSLAQGGVPVIVADTTLWRAAMWSRWSSGKLDGYWAFTGCRYHKGFRTCGNPDHFPNCPLPRHPLRNGRLNQTAYSLFLFIRDIAGGDIVSWIDQQVADYPGTANLPATRAALVDPLRHVYGISDKVIAMALASLLMGAGRTRPGWFAVGASFVVVDTLVHNFLIEPESLTDWLLAIRTAQPATSQAAARTFSSTLPRPSMPAGSIRSFRRHFPG